MTTSSLSPASPARTGGQVSPLAAYGMLPARTLLFAFYQALIALLLGSWEASIAWWPFTAILGSLTTFALLSLLLGREGRGYRAFFRVDRAHLRADLLAALGVGILAGPVAYLPNVWAAAALWGDPLAAFELMFRPLPQWAVYATLVGFPLAVALTELPTYFGYAMPRVEALSGRRGWALGLAVFWLAAQHMTLPLIFDARFLAWRLVMFIPFALLVGLVLRWRPRLLPYMMAIHFLADLQVGIVFFTL